jgi:hypothetical protein
MTIQDGVVTPRATEAGRPRAAVRGQRLDVLGLCMAYRAAFATLAAMPLSVLATNVVGDHPRGDAVLWDPGGLWLVEAVRVAGPALRALVPYGSLFIVLAAFGWLLPLGALIASCGAGTETLAWRQLLGRAAVRFPTLALIFGATLLLQAVTLALATVCGNLLAGMANDQAHGGDALRVAGPAFGLFLAWLIALGQDVLRVPLVQRSQSLYQGVSTSWMLLRDSARPLLVAAAWRTALAWLAFLLAGVAAAGLTGGAADRLPLVVALHLLPVAVFVWLRGSWFSWLSERLAGLPPQRAPEPAGDPSLLPDG